MKAHLKKLSGQTLLYGMGDAGTRIIALLLLPVFAHILSPAEYGELVGVTPHGARPYVTLLWFQKPDRSIVAIPVNTALNRIERPTLTVPRR